MKTTQRDRLAELVGETRKEFMKASVNRKPQYIINKRYKEYVDASNLYYNPGICYDIEDRRWVLMKIGDS